MHSIMIYSIHYVSHVISISIQMMSDEFEDFTHHQQVALDLRIKNATYSEAKNFYYEPLSSSTSKNNCKNNIILQKIELENKSRLPRNTGWKENGIVGMKGAP